MNLWLLSLRSIGRFASCSAVSVACLASTFVAAQENVNFQSSLSLQDSGNSFSALATDVPLIISTQGDGYVYWIIKPASIVGPSDTLDLVGSVFSGASSVVDGGTVQSNGFDKITISSEKLAAGTKYVFYYTGLNNSGASITPTSDGLNIQSIPFSTPGATSSTSGNGPISKPFFATTPGGYAVLTVDISPLASDIGKVGYFYIVAKVGSTWFTKTASGWKQMFAFSPSATGTLAAKHTFDIINGDILASDLSTLSIKVYAGYSTIKYRGAFYIDPQYVPPTISSRLLEMFNVGFFEGDIYSTNGMNAPIYTFGR